MVGRRGGQNARTEPGAPRGSVPIRRSVFPGEIFGSRVEVGTTALRGVAVVGWFGGACRELARSLQGACRELAGKLGGGHPAGRGGPEGLDLSYSHHSLL
jgi:hypothetical protein